MKAERKHWKIKLKEISKPERINFSMQFTDEQFEKITNGLIPQEMEDKWFIFYENNWLYFHRSWTGYCQYKMQITKAEDEPNYTIKEFFVERNPDIYRGVNDYEEIERLCFIILYGLLGFEECKNHLLNDAKSAIELIKAWSNFGNMKINKNDHSEKQDEFNLLSKNRCGRN